MQRLFSGTVKFRYGDFNSHRQLFDDLGDQQSPHTLFIGCSDSRLVPNLITNTLPGELFTVRNIANIVPPFGKRSEYAATTAAIEYAVKLLKVENILICGHSNCGGCHALYENESFFDDLPHTKRWLELAAGVREKVIEQVGTDDHVAREWLTEQYNIVEQIRHLLSYPIISEKFLAGQLKIYGWYYIIKTGEIFNYNMVGGFFEPLN